VLAVTLWAAGCGAALAASGVNVWLDVPFVRQQKQGCGPASVAMVMEYWQQMLHRPAQAGADAAEILRELPPGRHGVTAAAMVSYFQQHDYRAFAYAGDWGNVEQELAKGRPLIAALKPSGGEELHYVVLAGVDDAEQVVLLNDPAERKLLKEDRAQFEREWKATGNWTLLAVPKVK
jgi:ABC-type bacteriocin/lantibiotic exporter with double-glycine peptidase domain